MKSEKNNFFYRGHPGDFAVSLYVDALLRDDLSPLAGEVLGHVEECPECKDKILDLFLFLKNPDATGTASVRRKVVQMPVRRRLPFYARKAAAVFFLFALIFIAYFLIYKPGFLTEKRLPIINDDTTRQHISHSSTEPAKNTAGKEIGEPIDKPAHESGKGIRRKLPPPGYRVNPNLENMIGSQSRSAVVQVHSPRNNSYPTKDILFSWDETRQKSLHLKILNNKNEALFEYRIEKSSVVFKEKLPPGLYYWKLESKTDLLYVGKFFIK